MIELTVSLGTVVSVLAALAIWDGLKLLILRGLAEKAEKPQEETAEEQEKRHKEEMMLEGFSSLMNYDMETARAALRGEEML